jgi:hypothetical protein
MQKLKYKDYFCGVETRRVFVEALRFSEVGKDFAARAVIELLCDVRIRCLRFYVMGTNLQAYIENRGQRKR